MALDSAAKRKSAAGAGRPYMRTHQPDATPAGLWRATGGISYGGNAIASPVVSDKKPPPIQLLSSPGKLRPGL